MNIIKWFGGRLGACVADPERAVVELPVVPGTELEHVRRWNATAVPYPSEFCLHELIEAQVVRTPDATAVACGNALLSYSELNARANKLAHKLRSLGVGPDVRVGICVERSPEMVIGLLAILKAGGAYLPLDPAFPKERLGYMLADSALAAVLTQAPARAALEGALVGIEAQPAVIDLDAHRGLWAAASAKNPDRAAVELTPEHLAYVIYTSGSTGQPKGVMVEHRQVLNTLCWMQSLCGLNELDVILQKTTLNFDPSVFELFWPLMTGARVHLACPDGHKDPKYLAELIQTAGVTTVYFSPSMFGVFLDNPCVSSCSSLRTVVCGGEELPASLVARFKTHALEAKLHNLYGPTEVGIIASGATIDSLDGPVTIGRPIANARIYLLDGELRQVPLGTAGEIYIGGAGVARGYLNRPELTVERFIASPFIEGDRLYKTGDLARYLSDGNIEFLGRNDFQVKIRGARIELGEVEARLASYPGVREAVVIASEDALGELRLVAYYVVEGRAEAPEAEALRAHMLAGLPDYIAPAAYVRLEALPLMPTGKLDRRALPVPGPDDFGRAVYSAAQGEVETMLAQIWTELLGVRSVGRADNFFELGGHSLLAARLISRIREALGRELSLAAVFEQPSLADMGALVVRSPVATRPIVAVQQDESLKVPLIQQKLWFLSPTNEAGLFDQQTASEDEN